MTGTFAIVFCGTGAIIIDQTSGGVVTHFGIAMIFGMIVMSMIYALGNVSGAHFNPAVSVAFTIARKFPAKQLLPYILSQLTGALLASIFLKLVFPHNTFLGATIPAGSDLQSFVIELVLTFFLMLTILKVATEGKMRAVFVSAAIGGVVGLEALFAGPISGASMNPARSLAPAVVSGHIHHLWIYLLAPVIGACLAVPCWKLLKGEISVLKTKRQIN
ncbi:aquaporin [Taibaiella soli]|uniref:Aquaporin n=2 Tax=Taibaiella soli TaxID=1649169 RepID=A0A2W2BG19_9BACT|nr:aquaporin [Taibaiella soli]